MLERETIEGCLICIMGTLKLYVTLFQMIHNKRKEFTSLPKLQWEFHVNFPPFHISHQFYFITIQMNGILTLEAKINWNIFHATWRELASIIFPISILKISFSQLRHQNFNSIYFSNRDCHSVFKTFSVSSFFFFFFSLTTYIDTEVDRSMSTMAAKELSFSLQFSTQESRSALRWLRCRDKTLELAMIADKSNSWNCISLEHKWS